MKTQEEYARKIDGVVRRDVESCQDDWFEIDRKMFMRPENKNKTFILGTRKAGCDLIVLGGTNCNETKMGRVFGCLDNDRFYVRDPFSIHETKRGIREVSPLYAFKIASEYLRGQGMAPVFDGAHYELMKL